MVRSKKPNESASILLSISFTIAWLRSTMSLFMLGSLSKLNSFAGSFPSKRIMEAYFISLTKKQPPSYSNVLPFKYNFFPSDQTLTPSTF